MTREKLLQEALNLAVNIIMANEPGDSRAVSDEAVALAAVASGDTSDAVMKVIRDAADWMQQEWDEMSKGADIDTAGECK